jgi:hypothetical protein
MKALMSAILLLAAIWPGLAETAPQEKVVSTSEEALAAFRQQYDASPSHLGLSAAHEPSIKDPRQLHAEKLALTEFARFRRRAESPRGDPWRLYGSLEPFKQDIEVWWITNTDVWHRFGAFLDAGSGHVFFIMHYSTPF